MTTTSSQAVSDILLKHHVERIGYLPCEKLGPLAARLTGKFKVWDLTRECAGVSLAFGWALGGSRSALLIQSTGLGNLITELMTLQVLYGVGLPILVSWRGHYREPIEAQVILGERLPQMLEALGVPVHAIETPNDLAELDDGVGRCLSESKVEVFLLSPELWVNETPTSGAPLGVVHVAAVHVDEPAFTEPAELSRAEAIEAVLSGLPAEAVVVAQIGFPARELFAAKDRPRNLYLLGALGAASLVGLGLAQARPDLQVYVLDGDGAFILNPNQMLELAQELPSNLHVVLLDNGAWGSTGSQPTMTARGLNLAAFGKAVGVGSWRRAVTADDWAKSKDASIIHFLIKAGNAPVGMISLKARELAARFEEAIRHGP